MSRVFFKFLLIYLTTFHMGLTVLYLLPPNPVTKHYQNITHQYMDPIFTQNWNLFSPDPVVYNLKLIYRCEIANSSWSQWQDPISELIKSHQNNRLLFKGKLIYTYHGMYRNLLNKNSNSMKASNCDSKDLGCENKRRQAFSSTPEVKIVNDFVRAVCKSQFGNDKNQFKIVKIYPKKFSERNLVSASHPAITAFESGGDFANP